MILQEFYDRMRAEVRTISIGRQDSSAFLIWFLENFYRIELQDAIDSVCDHQNDKGIDGIFVDEEEEKIYIFQSKYSPSNDHNQGDGDIRNFIGARQWFTNESTIDNLMNSTASRELKSLVERTEIREKVNSYEVITVFVTNKIFNEHAREFISINPQLEHWDQNDLFNKFTYFADEDNNFPRKEIFLTNSSKIEYDLPDGTKARIYSIKAKELVKLEGIQDRTLFYKNVRYGVGKSRVNTSIKKTIDDHQEHGNFFLYHNGITIISQELEESNDRIYLTGYAVVNGCQSMITFFENKDSLTNNIQILVKVVKISLSSPLVKKITHYANNQNSISLKDLRSNDRVQRALQTEFRELCGNSVFYKIKKGENTGTSEEIIEKDFAAQLITSVYLEKPQNTHLKQKLFGEDYNIIFSRNIKAEKIYLSNILYKTISNNSELLDNEQIRGYGLSIFFFCHVLGIILREDPLGRRLLDNPKQFVTTQKNQLLASLEKLWMLITPDINMDIEEYTQQQNNFFDYKNLFKNGDFVKTMTAEIKSNYLRLTRRNPEDAFSAIFENSTSLNPN